MEGFASAALAAGFSDEGQGCILNCSVDHSIRVVVVQEWIVVIAVWERR